MKKHFSDIALSYICGRLSGMQRAQDYIQRILDKADLHIGTDIQVHNSDTYARIAAGGRLAIGETYMDGWWSSHRLDHVTSRLLHVDALRELTSDWRAAMQLAYLTAKSKLVNRQKRSRAEAVADTHYNLDNELFEGMLGNWMMYSCAYFGRGADNLDQAQEDKLRLIADKLHLEKGMTVLSIGCGWGQLEHFLASTYDVQVTGVTIAEEQLAYAEKRFSHPNVMFRFQDYREIPATDVYDRVISIAMFEAVGQKNYDEFFAVMKRHLKDDGIALLHTIGGTPDAVRTDPWIDKYIFPNGVLPSAKQIALAIDKKFVIEDWHNFGQDYDKTLLAWWENFQALWPSLEGKYDERFYRMWQYYLLTCAGSFRARYNHLWHIVMTKRGLVGGYVPVR